MFTNKTILATAMAATAALGASQVLAATDESTQAQIDQLKKQIDALEKQQQAQSAALPASAPAGPRVVQSGSNKFSLESADGQYSVALTGRVHFDAGFYSFQPDSTIAGVNGVKDLSNGVNARRARIGASGKLAGNWTYAFIYDAGNSQDGSPAGIQVAQVSYTGIAGVIIDLPGYSEPPYPLDTSVSSNDLMFLERPIPVNVATNLGAGDFRANTGVRFYGDRYWIGAYFTGPAQGDSHTGVHERFGAFQRASAQVLSGPNYSLHLGVNAFELLQVPDTLATATTPASARTVTLSDRPELRIDPTALVTTGTIGSLANPVTGANVYGLELAGGWNSIYWQAEYFRYEVDRRALGTNRFDGGYLQASWTLTGESRKYVPTTGAYSAITPRRPFGVNGGTGAWEIAARLSYTDLTDDFTAGVPQASRPGAVNGGRVKNATLGVNWYVNTNLRLMLNYVHSELDRASGAAAAGVPLGSAIGYQFDGFALRTQLAW